MIVHYKVIRPVGVSFRNVPSFEAIAAKKEAAQASAILSAEKAILDAMPEGPKKEGG